MLTHFFRTVSFQRHFIHPEGWLDTVSNGNSLRNADVSLFYYLYHRRRFKCAVGVKYTYFLLPFGDPTGWFPLDFPSVPQKTSVWSPDSVWSSFSPIT